MSRIKYSYFLGGFMKDEKKRVEEKKNIQGISRRQFLIRSGVVAAGLSAFQLSEFLNAPHIKAAGGPPILIGGPKRGPKRGRTVRSD